MMSSSSLSGSLWGSGGFAGETCGAASSESAAAVAASQSYRWADGRLPESVRDAFPFEVSSACSDPSVPVEAETSAGFGVSRAAAVTSVAEGGLGSAAPRQAVSGGAQRRSVSESARAATPLGSFRVGVDASTPACASSLGRLGAAAGRNSESKSGCPPCETRLLAASAASAASARRWAS
ncbi:hypothetical protein [Agromyces bracchium]|uniref:hypothetical protein n=1 Tax=Agromyces bracchium TaxID=88376 RepID=UPI0031D47597